MDEKTRSICPVCHKTITAERIRQDGRIYLTKVCPEHGAFKALLWNKSALGSQVLAWENWTTESVNTPPSVIDVQGSRGCPHDCGLCPDHQQQACCVLVELTQNCDQNCAYCFAAAHSGKGSADDPTIEEIQSLYGSLIARNTERPFNIQLSGGEPTMRGDLPDIIRMGRAMGFPYIQLNTNGRRIAGDPSYAIMLRNAGLSSVFLQFDGTKDGIYRNIRGQSLLSVKEEAIRNCAAAGLGTVLVVTIVPGVNDHDLGSILRYAVQRHPYVRGIHLQPVSYFGRFPKEPSDLDRITIPDVITRLFEQSEGKLDPGMFVPLQTGHPRCSFHGNFAVLPDGSLKPLSSTVKKCGCGNREASIEKARDYIANKWTITKGRKLFEGQGAYDYASWDEMLDRIESSSFSITAMAFQDAWNLDLERLRKCRVHIAAGDGKLIPFCAYNILHRDIMGGKK